MSTAVATKKGVCVDPSTTDEQRQEIHRANKRVHDRAAERDERRRKASEKASRESAAREKERRHDAVNGLRRLAKRKARAGQEDQAAKLERHAKDAAAALKLYEEQTKLLEARRPDPLDDAATEAGKKVMKTLPGFADLDEARAWALRNLPLTAARHEASAIADRYYHASRDRTDTLDRYWSAVSAGARLATGKVFENEAIQLVIAAGL